MMRPSPTSAPSRPACATACWSPPSPACSASGRSAIGAYVSPGQPVATLIDDSQMRLEFGVPSIYLADLRPGLEINAITKDIPGRTFVGKLTSIDNAIDPVTLAVKVRATLPNRDGALKAGSSMSVQLVSKPRTSLVRLRRFR